MLQFTCDRRQPYFAPLAMHMTDACSKERKDIVRPVGDRRPARKSKNGVTFGQQQDFEVLYMGQLTKVTTQHVSNDLWCIIKIEDIVHYL